HQPAGPVTSGTAGRYSLKADCVSAGFGGRGMKNRTEPFTRSAGTQLLVAMGASLLVAALAPLASVRAADVTVVTNFQADKGPGYRKPNPDGAGAVGPKHTAVLDDRAFVVQDKATGKVLQNDTQHDFWLKVLPAKTFDLQANDPR